MNTFEEFKENMDWSTLELPDNVLEHIYHSVASDIYPNIETLEEFYDLEDYAVTWDVNLHSVLETFQEVIERGKLRWISLFYLPEDEVYAGVLTYDY